MSGKSTNHGRRFPMRDKRMSIEANKALARLWFAEGWNQGNVSVADGIFSPHLTLNGIEVGLEGPKQNVLRTRRGFPDITLTIKDQIAEEDRVVTRWIAQGTHLGELEDLPPTGLVCVVSGIVIWHVVDSRVREDHTVAGEATLLQQLTALLTSSEKS
jgi:predicted ester cyclase